MHNLVIRKSSLLYIFQTQHLTMPIHSPSLSTITLPLHSPSLSAIMLPQSPPPSISLPHPFRSIAVAGTLVLCRYPFRTLTIPAAVDYRYVALPFYCFVLYLFCGKWMFIRG